MGRDQTVEWVSPNFTVLQSPVLWCNKPLITDVSAALADAARLLCFISSPCAYEGWSNSRKDGCF